MERWHYEPGSHVVTVPGGGRQGRRERQGRYRLRARGELLDGWMAVRRDLNLSRMAPLFAGVNEPTEGNSIARAHTCGWC